MKINVITSAALEDGAPETDLFTDRAKSRPFSRISHLNTLDVQICTSTKKANTVTIINMSANGGKLIGYNCRREA